MSKLYVFGIGGTGSRVLRSLTMLLSSGVDINVDTIVPIIVDSDSPGGNLTQTVNLMNDYQKIHDELLFTSSTANNFFKTEIKGITNNCKMNVANTQDEIFRVYIDEPSLQESNKAIVNMLFSEDNLNADMKVGFKGNPNIGSVVLNQFTRCTDFKKFADDFKAGDRIFIISSIFGGTGASGFPVLLKTLRTLNEKTDEDDVPFGNANIIQQAPIGAITVLPYFGITTDADSGVLNSSTFISKAKAALSYYKGNMNSLDYMYYISDNPQNNYDNHDGGAAQKNDAHFVELAAALSIVDFCNQDIENPGQAPKYKEFGIKNDALKITLDDLHDVTEQQIAKPMARLLLMSNYLDTQMSSAARQPWYIKRLEANYVSSPFFTRLKKLCLEYRQWLLEMENNKRGFSPFDLSNNSSAVFDIVHGRKAKKVFSTKSNFALMDDRLNSAEGKIARDLSANSYLVELFYIAENTLVEEKLNLQ